MLTDATSYWRLLAGSQDLSAEMVERIWSSGVHSARLTLAGRDDLCDELSERILSWGDPGLVRAWAIFPGRKSGHVDLAVLACNYDELTAAHLARQRNLSRESAFALLAKAGGNVASAFLEREAPLAREVQVEAASRLSQSRVFAGWHSVSYLTGIVGADRQLWETMINDCPDGSTAIPLAAIEACEGDVELCRAALLWWAHRPRVDTEESRQDAVKTWDAVLRCYGLTVEDYQMAARAAWDPRQSARALELAAIDPYSAVNAILSGSTSPDVLDRVVAAAGERVNLPFPALVLAGLRAPNREQVSGYLDRLRPRLLKKGSREVLATLWFSGEEDLAAEFVETSGSLLWGTDEWGPCPGGLVAKLAAAGSRALLRSPVCDEHPELVALNYAPLPMALSVPAVASCVLAELEDAAAGSPSTLETALALLGQWQGCLTDLVRAAEALTGAPPQAR